MKAVIPAAGRGTRFLPYTKAQPKEMIPVVDKPAIQYVLEEAVSSGIPDVLIVTGRGKRAIEDHFDSDAEPVHSSPGRQEGEGLRELNELMQKARVAYVRQDKPRGLGDAVLCVQSLIGTEDFAVLLGDNIMMDEVPCTEQLLGFHERLGASVLALQEVSGRDISRYGVATGEVVEPGLILLEDIIEKPPVSRVQSNYVAIGRYVLTSKIFGHLRKVEPDDSGELQLTDGIRSLLTEEDVYGVLYSGRRYDVGDKAGWLLANLDLALKRPEFEDVIRSYISARVS